MNVFLSYASEDWKLADKIQLALTGADYEVFFDRENLTPADDYHEQIRSAVEHSDFFVFLISPDSVCKHSYALTELEHAKEKWHHPKGRVLPVLVREVSYENIPNYLQAVTVLEPVGDISAEVLRAISKLSQKKHRAWLTQTDLNALSIKEHFDAPALNDDEIRLLLKKLPRGWSITASPLSTATDRALRKEFEEYFYDRILDMAMHIGGVARSLDHHPDILISGHARLTVESWSHTRRDVTLKDFILAHQIERALAAGLSTEPVIGESAAREEG